jgi:hypothetical protein
MICFRYDFLGYELPQIARDLEFAEQNRPARSTKVRASFSRLRCWFLEWMLEPVNYPLKT